MHFHKETPERWIDLTLLMLFLRGNQADNFGISKMCAI